LQAEFGVEKMDNHKSQKLREFFGTGENVVEALRLIKEGSDNEPYLSNRLIRICMLLAKPSGEEMK
jgi:hypothetical protein